VARDTGMGFLPALLALVPTIAGAVPALSSMFGGKKGPDAAQQAAIAQAQAAADARARTRRYIWIGGGLVLLAGGFYFYNNRRRRNPKGKRKSFWKGWVS